MSFEPRRPLDDPARSMGIIGLIFSISGIFCVFVALIGLVISIVAFVRSRRAQFHNTYALAGIIVAAVFAVISVVLSWPWIRPLLFGG